MKRVSAAAAALFCLGLASQVSAGVIYQQPPVWNGSNTPISSSWTSHVDPQRTGWRAYDDFAPASDDVVREVTWYGVYLDAALAEGMANTTSWEVAFYADNGGTLGAPLFTAPVTVTSKKVGTSSFGAAVNIVTVYAFTAAIPDFNVSAGTTYWFSPLSLGPTFDDYFSWIDGAGGDGATFQQFLVGGNAGANFTRPGDRAFTLRNSVPEPASLALLGAGVAMVLARRRRA